jgi:hypothetical protein
VVRLLVPLEDESDRSQLEAVAVVKPRAVGEGSVDAAGGGRVAVSVHPLVRVGLAPNDSVLGFEAGELYVLGVGAADGHDVPIEGERSLDARSFGGCLRGLPAGGDDEAWMPVAHPHIVIGRAALVAVVVGHASDLTAAGRSNRFGFVERQ